MTFNEYKELDAMVDALVEFEQTEGAEKYAAQIDTLIDDMVKDLSEYEYKNGKRICKGVKDAIDTLTDTLRNNDMNGYDFTTTQIFKAIECLQKTL